MMCINLKKINPVRNKSDQIGSGRRNPAAFCLEIIWENSVNIC